MPVKDMVALITGGAGVLGFATARKLVADGYKVMLMDLPVSKGDERVKELGSSAAFTPGDIMSEGDVTRTLDEVKEKFGKLNVIVNAAGLVKSRLLFNFSKGTSTEFEELTKILNVNVGGTLNVLRLGIHLLAENKPDEDGLRGVVINTSGFAEHNGQMGHVVMSASWGAISSMTQPLCREFGTVGVRVVTISPGVMDGYLSAVLPPKVKNHFGVLTPSPKRFGRPEEYAHLVQTIVENKFLNGDTIKLDGGLRLQLG